MTTKKPWSQGISITYSRRSEAYRGGRCVGFEADMELMKASVSAVETPQTPHTPVQQHVDMTSPVDAKKRSMDGDNGRRHEAGVRRTR
jgi:hypothetical protein